MTSRYPVTTGSVAGWFQHGVGESAVRMSLLIALLRGFRRAGLRCRERSHYDLVVEDGERGTVIVAVEHRGCDALGGGKVAGGDRYCVVRFVIKDTHVVFIRGKVKRLVEDGYALSARNVESDGDGRLVTLVDEVKIMGAFVLGEIRVQCRVRYGVFVRAGYRSRCFERDWCGGGCASRVIGAGCAGEAAASSEGDDYDKEGEGYATSGNHTS